MSQDDDLATIDSGFQGLMDAAAASDGSETRGLMVEFDVEPQINDAKSAKAGRPIYDEVEVCNIRVIGSADIVKQNAEDAKNRFPKQYVAWKKKHNQQAVSGTLLTMWPPIPKALVEEAKHFGAFTVEQLAEIPDSNIKQLGPGWVTWRQKARDYLLASKDTAILTKMRDELAERDRRINALEDMLRKQSAELHKDGGQVIAQATSEGSRVAALEAQIAALAEAVQSKNGEKKRPGRPPGSKNKPKTEPAV